MIFIMLTLENEFIHHKINIKLITLFEFVWSNKKNGKMSNFFNVKRLKIGHKCKSSLPRKIF